MKCGNMLSVGSFTDTELIEIENAKKHSGKNWNEFILDLIRNEAQT